MKTSIHLLVIDGQYDFADPRGSLYVPEGEIAIDQNLPMLINRLGQQIDDITLTMDCHTDLHVAHPMCWKAGPNCQSSYPTKRVGDRPDPFTIISVEDVENRIWDFAIPGADNGWGLHYVKSLASGGRYVLTIWPPHCIIGTHGNTIMPSLMEAVRRWEAGGPGIAGRVTKGSNWKTEHYSAIKADVPIDSDPSTQLNVDLIRNLESYDDVLIGGLATTHCVANTVRDIADAFGDAAVQKLVLLTDCCRGIIGPPGNDAGAVAARAMFKGMEDDFMADMIKLGMRTALSTDYRVTSRV